MAGASGRGPAETIQEVKFQRTLLQDFRPISQSLEIELAGHYWDVQGVRPFVENAVPYAVNNSGWAPEAAAKVLFANCLEHPDPTNPILLLELGAGLGLFARQLLDAFRHLCAAAGQNFYDRLTCYITDYSPATLQQWQQTAQFADHAHHAILARADALHPRTIHPPGGKTIELSRIRAIFANYVLDTLPIAIIQKRTDAIEQLCVRTWLGRLPEGVCLPHHLTPEDVVRLAASQKIEDRRQLVAILPWLEFEVAMRPDGASQIPFADEALKLSHNKRIMLNFGALQSLEQCQSLLHPAGFILINDYGPVQVDQSGQTNAPQRFGSSVATGLNFPLLEHCLQTRGLQSLTPPHDESRSIHSRLICSAPLAQTQEAFNAAFGDTDFQKADSIATAAAELLASGRLEDALAFYQRNIARCPSDWHTIALASEFLCQQLRKFDQSLELAQAAIAINPWYSAFLWNTLGNALFCLGKYTEAHEAYLKAGQIDADDPQTNLNMAYSLSQSGHHRKALAHIAHGLSHDHSGRFRAHLLDKQQHILAALAGQWAAETNLLNQRYAAFTLGG